MIILDICLNDIPQDKIKVAVNGKKYVKFVVSQMKQADRWGNDYTVYMQQPQDQRGKPRQYVGKGKEFGAKKPHALNDYPDDL